MTEPNLRTVANHIVSCKGMDDNLLCEEIITSIQFFLASAREKERINIYDKITTVFDGYKIKESA